MLPIDRRRFWTVCTLWLVTVTAFLIWFDYAAATAFLHPASDPMGRYAVPGPGVFEHGLPIYLRGGPGLGP